MSARNFLRSDVYPTLKEKVKVFIVSPLGDNPAFREEFSAPNITIHSVSYQRSLLRSFLARILFPLQAYWFTQKTKLRTLQFVRDLLKESEPLRYFRYVLMGETLGRIPGFRSLLSYLYFKSIQNPEIEALLDSTHFDLVFLTHGYVHLEVEMAVLAKRRNIPVVDMIHSWDNVTSKSGLRQMTNNQMGSLLPVQFFDRIIVWNEILRSELMDLYGYPAERIFIAGIPQFDPYVKIGKTSNRESYFKAWGGDPKKKTIFFIATSPSLIHDQTTIVKGMLDAFHEGRLKGDCQILIRTHPGADMSSWIEKFKGPGVFFQKPDSAFTPREIKTWEGKDSNPLALAESIYHCDVLINGMSTTAIESAVFDKPCICLGYDGDPIHNSSIHFYYENTHYEKLVRTGGVRIVWNEKELIDQINRYLEHPELDQEGRALIRSQQCFKLDGQSGRRIGNFLLQFINSDH